MEYEYFEALEHIQETMYQMNLFDVNSALLKHQDPLMDNKSDLTPESSTEEYADTVTFADVRAKEINRKIYWRAQQPEIDIAFSMMSKNFLVEELKKQTRWDIYQENSSNLDSVLEEFAKMELTPNG